ncbi:MAG: hypothetical protein ACI86H_002413 [bacterium]
MESSHNPFNLMHKLKKLFHHNLLEGKNSNFDQFTFKFFEGIDEIGKFISPQKMKDQVYQRLINYLLETLPEYESAQPLLGSIEEENTFINYKKKRFLEIAQPCDVILVRGNQRISRIIQTLTKSPYSHAAFYRGNGEIIEAEPDGVLISNIDKYLHLDIRICRPIMLGSEGKQKVIHHIEEMVHKQPKYDTTNIEKLLFKYWYTKFRPDTKVYIGGSTTFERYYICSGMIAHGFHKAHYPITPSLRFHNRRCNDRMIRNVKDYERVMSHLRKNYSQIVPADFDNSSFFASVKFLLMETEHYITHRKFQIDTEHDYEVYQDYIATDTSTTTTNQKESEDKLHHKPA